MAAGVEFGLLGPLEVRRGGVLVPVAPGRQRAVLAALLLNAGAVVPADELIEVLWDCAPPASARASLHNYVKRLRQALGDVTHERIVTYPRGYLARVEPGGLDVTRFEELLGAASAAARDGGWESAAGQARAALALWRGEPLADTGSDVLAVREVPRLAELRLQALEVAIDADLQLGRAAGVIGELWGLVAAHPLRERLHALLMLALYRDGRQAEALAAYAGARRVLAEELGTEPGPSLRELHQGILTGDPVLGGAPPGLAAAGGRAAVRWTLPRDIASFTGRGGELAHLAAAGVVGIQVITGMAGVGKTAFAVHAAHRLAPRFPGGQLFVPLHGHTPGRRPVDPADALAGLLVTAGFAAAQIPTGLAERAGLWRGYLADRQVLLVLDDATGSEQVEPLLPGTAGCLVLVTGRRHLTALADAQVISLDVLPPAEAAALLARLAARPGLPAGDPAAGEICALCGYLPLAIAMLAGRLRHHPAWTPAGLAADLAAARDRLAVMTAENVSAAAAFDLSYADLGPGQRRLFRRLGLHPGGDIDAYAAAALDDSPLAAARCGLQELYEHCLLTEPAAGRYRLHDLLREHAHARAVLEEADGDRDQAATRLLDYYTHTAALAEARLARQTRPAAGHVRPASLPAAVPDLPDSAAALAWARAERGNLLACLDQAGAAGDDTRVVALTAGLAALLRLDGPWAAATVRHAAAAWAARRCGDRLAEANALSDLAVVLRLTGDNPGAAQALEEGLGLYRGLGNRLGEANGLRGLGFVRRLTGDYAAAAVAQAAALDIYRSLGDRLGHANALLDLGVVRRMSGDYQDAAQVLSEALRLYRDLGDRLGQASALSFLGAVRRLTGDCPAATQALELALAITRDLGDRLGQANALISLGLVQQLTRDYPAAAQAHAEALKLFRDVGDRLGQAHALTNLGTVRRLTGDHQGAARALAEGLSTYRDVGNRGGEAEALNETGILHRMHGELAQAEACHRQALGVSRAIGGAWDEAHALAGLGRCALGAGRVAEAESSLRQAYQIFDRIGAAEAAGVAAELDVLTGHHPAGQRA